MYFSIGQTERDVGSNQDGSIKECCIFIIVYVLICVMFVSVCHNTRHMKRAVLTDSGYADR
jgi:t-SNARE complex subunit (syntaxin)